MTDEEYEVWLKDFNETMVDGGEVEAKTTQLGDMEMTVYRGKDTKPKVEVSGKIDDDGEVGIFSASGYEKVKLNSLPPEVQKQLLQAVADNEELVYLKDVPRTADSEQMGQKKQVHAEFGDDDILGAITDMLVNDLKRNNFTFRHDVEKRINCFPYIMLERYEEIVVPIKPKRIHRRISTFVVTLGSNEATAGFELTAEEAIFLGKEHRKKYPKRLLDSKSWPRQEPPTILNRIYTKVQDAVVCLELAYSVENLGDKLPPPNYLSEPHISH